ncbi:dihydropteridine reductase isoform X1 [Neodiprion virginianus]|uniref:Dihydropteridine reductase n=2 Tax=Neodiprion lecontei TaxID=441921 RepID=A0A6J0BTV2_NEOLC|nr:dihydropteridine reductase isoform X1 [Neodiprion lecontei]XP_046417704.1 dihydropteridine reductase isoform X1 [Neodiprion fabricii]XP_046611148.1 dihydropteridine reductase isoform X1 [Neodiprion virginianus]
MAAAVLGRVLVYGGKGALGSTCVTQFKSKNWWVGSIDMRENDLADVNVIVPSNATWEEQENQILSQIKEVLKGEKLDGVICVAGGWAGGNAASKDYVKNSDLMWKQSVWSSVIASSIAAHHLKQGGFLTLTGAKPAIEGTPGMIGYGMAKAAVHQLTKSLANEGSGLPKDSLVATILPVTLDTPMNRKWMPDADTSTWTPLEFVAGLFFKWGQNQDRPSNGSLLQLITKNNQTELITV